MAGLRAGGYRTCGAFLARARQMHLLQMGKTVDDSVEYWCKEYLRSAERGRGAAALKDGFDFAKIMELDYKTSCLGKLMGLYCEGIAALNPRALLLGGVWWRTRSIELQNTKMLPHTFPRNGNARPVASSNLQNRSHGWGGLQIGAVHLPCRRH